MLRGARGGRVLREGCFVMPRPKKSPRVRLQVVLERDQAARLRKFAKANDSDISQIVRWAVKLHLDRCELDAVSGGRA